MTRYRLDIRRGDAWHHIGDYPNEFMAMLAATRYADDDGNPAPGITGLRITPPTTTTPPPPRNPWQQLLDLLRGHPHQ